MMRRRAADEVPHDAVGDRLAATRGDSAHVALPLAADSEKARLPPRSRGTPAFRPTIRPWGLHTGFTLLDVA